MTHLPMNLDLVRSAVSATASNTSGMPSGVHHGVVTIARETGTAAPKIASRICELLNERHTTDEQHWIPYDRNLVDRIAEEHELEADIVARLDEHDQGKIDELIASFAGKATTHTVAMKSARTIRGLGRGGRSVIVGRGGAAILAGLDHSLHVRLKAPLEWRVRQWMKVKGLEHDAARDEVERLDRERAEYVHTIANRDVNDPDLYDLVIDVRKLTAECAAHTIARAVEEMHLEDD